MLVFPDVEAMTVAYLKGVLAPIYPDVRVGTDVAPETDWTGDPVAVQVTVSGSGSEMADSVVFQNVLLGFDAYAPTTAVASNLIRDVQAYIAFWKHSTDMVTRHSTNAFPSRVRDIDYPHYWHSANLAVKAREIEEA